MLFSVFDRVENIAGTEEIACTNFFFPQCFQNASFPNPSKGVIVWECWTGQTVN